MVEDGDSSGSGGRPDPDKVTTAAEFVDAMRRLKLWTGWGYRRLAKNAAAAGQALPRSTLTVALGRTTLPREELVAALARACGCDDDETELWVAARRRIAATPDLVADPPAEARVRPRVWPVRFAVIFLVFAMAATIVGFILRKENPATPGAGPGHAAPAQPDQSRARPDPPAPGTTAPTSTTAPGPGRPATLATTATGPIPRIPLAPGRPAPDIPAGPTTTTPLPPAPTTPTTPAPPTREETQLADGRTVHCPLPYRTTDAGPLAQCTMTTQSGPASIGIYNPLTRDFNTTWGNLDIVESTWYDAPTLASDGIQARTRGFATIATPYGGAVWATQYSEGQARIGIFNIVANRFAPRAAAMALTSPGRSALAPEASSANRCTSRQPGCDSM